MLQMGWRLVAAVVLALLALTTAIAASQQIQEDELQKADSLRRTRRASTEAHKWYGGAYKQALTNVLESITKKENIVERGYSGESVLDAFKQAKDDHYLPNAGNGKNKTPMPPNSSKGTKHKTSKRSKGSGKSGNSKTTKGSKNSNIGGGSSGDDKNYPEPIQTRRVPNVVLSYVLPMGNIRYSPKPTDPTEDTPTYTDYAILAQVTAKWFEQAVRDQLVPNGMFLLSVDAKLDYATSGEGNPEPRFNAMIVYDYIEYTYYVTTNAAPNAPSAAKLNAVMRDSITSEYVLNAVRTVEAFSAVNEVFYQLIGRPLPPPPPSIRPPTAPPPPSPSPPNTSPPTGLEPFVPPGPISNANNAVLIGPFYIDYSVSVSPIEPTQEQYDQQVAVTIDYFNAVFDQRLREGGLSDVFYGAEAVSVNFRSYAVSVDRFNIVIEYESLILSFAANDQTDIELYTRALEQLSAKWLQVLIESITAYFITDVVRSVGGAFSSVTEVILRASDNDSP